MMKSDSWGTVHYDIKRTKKEKTKHIKQKYVLCQGYVKRPVQECRRTDSTTCRSQ